MSLPPTIVFDSATPEALALAVLEASRAQQTTRFASADVSMSASPSVAVASRPRHRSLQEIVSLIEAEIESLTGVSLVSGDHRASLFQARALVE